MNTTDVTDQHLAYWRSDPEIAVVAARTMRPPEGMASCESCASVITETSEGDVVVRVPWKPDETDLAHLKPGRDPVALDVPPHQIEVQAP